MATTESKPQVQKSSNGLRRWDPFSAFNEMQEEMLRLWGQTWPLVPRPLSYPLRRLAPSEWMPTIDVYEKNGMMMVKAELPGVKKEDTEVALEQGDLVIRGQRKTESEVKEENYYRMERSHGSFYRRIPLPFEVKPEQITASFKDGVLEVQVPRPPREQPQPQPIAIS